MLKVAYLGFNRRYVNRTLQCQLRAFALASELHRFGPGFSTPADLDRGPEHWLGQNGPFDIVMFDSYVFEYPQIAARSRPFAGDSLAFPASRFFSYGPAIHAACRDFDGAKILIGNWDYYAIAETVTRRLADERCRVFDSSMSARTVDELGLSRHAATEKGFVGGTSTDHWVAFRRAYPELIIDFPHCIGEEEFGFVATADRPTAFAVPGTSYAERRALYGALPLGTRFRQLRTRISDRLYYTRHDSLTPEKLASIHGRYDAELAASRSAFVSGSVYRAPVRKYFEVGAAGAAPIGQRCEGFDDLGFEDGRNFIVAETPAEVRAAIAAHDPDRLAGIADAARRLVWDSHSVHARAEQFGRVADAIAAGQYSGSRWRSGQLELMG